MQGITNLVLKSGTNVSMAGLRKYSEYGIRSKGFFTKANPVEHQNEYGLHCGPVLHDRIFYFGSYTLQITTGSSPQFVTIPTPAERSGDFSAFPVQIFDPASTVCSGACAPGRFLET